MLTHHLTQSAISLGLGIYAAIILAVAAMTYRAALEEGDREGAVTMLLLAVCAVMLVGYLALGLAPN